MITIITGASHTGKTALAHRLMVKTQTPYLSIDHIKMGLIRTGICPISVLEDAALTEYLWPIIVEIIKTAIENNQNLIVEGLYVPELWIQSFADEHLQHIRFCCLVMSSHYIENNFEAIQKHANVIETRLDSSLSKEDLIKENQKFFDICENNLYPYYYIDGDYYIDIEPLLI